MFHPDWGVIGINPNAELYTYDDQHWKYFSKLNLSEDLIKKSQEYGWPKMVLHYSILHSMMEIREAILLIVLKKEICSNCQDPSHFILTASWLITSSIRNYTRSVTAMNIHH